MTVEGIMDAYQGHRFQITIANLSRVDIPLLQSQDVGEVANVPVQIVHIKDERQSYHHDVHSKNGDSIANDIHYKTTPDRL